jgi:hypothetical protein
MRNNEKVLDSPHAGAPRPAPPTASIGSAITGYIVTPYILGIAQTPITYSSPATTETVSGLILGDLYTFSVTAINGVGTGPVATPSSALGLL